MLRPNSMKTQRELDLDNSRRSDSPNPYELHAMNVSLRTSMPDVLILMFHLMLGLGSYGQTGRDQGV